MMKKKNKNDEKKEQKIFMMKMNETALKVIKSILSN